MAKLPYWAERAKRQEEQLKLEAEVVHSRVSKAYDKASSYLEGQVHQLYSRFGKKSELPEDIVKQILNSRASPEDLTELRAIANNVENEAIKKSIDDYMTGLAFKSRISRLEELKAKAYIISRSVADVELHQATDFFIDTIHQAYNESAVEAIIGQTENDFKEAIFNGKELPKNVIDFSKRSEENPTTVIPGDNSKVMKVKNGKLIRNESEKITTVIPSDRQTVFKVRDGKLVLDTGQKVIQLHQDKVVPEIKELSTRYVQNVLESHWVGSNYSKRVWKDNTDALAKRLDELFTVEAMTGMTESEMIQAIRHEFNVSSFVAKRLIRTEANYMANQAKLKGWQNHGVERYKLLVVHDLRTSEICQHKSNEDKIYLVSEAVVNGKDGTYPPFHPFCRTVAVAYFGERSERGNVRYFDPISDSYFEMARGSTYKAWEDMLIKKHGKDKVDSKRAYYKKIKVA